MRNLNNRQKPHRRNPIARLLPRFKPAVTRDRTKYSRKGRAARRLLRDAKGSTGWLCDAPRLTPCSTVTVGAGNGILDDIFPGGSGARPKRPLRKGFSLRAEMRRPCAFTETDVKRAIRAVRAAGETPGRLVVTKDGFAVELAPAGAAGVAGAAGAPGATDAAAANTPANTWDDMAS